MKYLTIFLIFSLSIPHLSCDPEKNANSAIESKEGSMRIDLSLFRELAKEAGTIVEKVDFFQLETNSESLIGKINKVLTTNEELLILDTQTTARVYIFDHTGKFIRNIAKEGNGPGEYSFLGDMDIDCQNNLHLLDLRKAKILQYRLDGTFIGENKFGFLTRNFGVLQEHAYLFDQGTRRNEIVDLDYKLITWVPNSQKLKKFIRFSEIYDSYFYPLPSLRSLYRSGDQLYYSRPYQYTVYQPISENEVVEKYFIDFGEHQVPKSFYSNYSNDGDNGKFMFDLLEKDYAHNIFNVLETSKYFCFNFQAGKKIYWAAISKQDNSATVRDLSLMDLQDYPFVLTPHAVAGDQFVSLLSPDAVQYLKKKWGEKKLKDAGLSVLAKHDINMNPILVKWSLKDSI